jgi:predicted permease
LIQVYKVLVDAVLPVFSIIFLGYLLRIKGVAQSSYVRTANQIVYYVALPAMILNTIAREPFNANVDLVAAVCVLSAMVILAVVALGIAKVLRIAESDRGTFMQSCFHGNIGYMAYAIAYYALGASQFALTAVLSSFLMVGQNVLAVWALTAFRSESSTGGRWWTILKYTSQNPIILSILVGISYSAAGLAIPHPVQRGLDILSGMALPTALLLIGASLSFGAIRLWVKEMIAIGMLKLICLPAVGYLLMKLVDVPQSLMLSGVILLAAPPATVTFVMAGELGGSPELAATSVSVVTLFSAITYSLFLAAFV